MTLKFIICHSLKSFGRKDLLTRHSRSCKPNDEEVASVVKEQDSKRKWHQRNSTLHCKGVQGDVAFMTPSMLLPPPEIFKSGGEHTIAIHEENKENIPPFLLPIGPMFNAANLHGADSKCPKKARTRF